MEKDFSTIYKETLKFVPADIEKSPETFSHCLEKGKWYAVSGQTLYFSIIFEDDLLLHHIYISCTNKEAAIKDVRVTFYYNHEGNVLEKTKCYSIPENDPNYDILTLENGKPIGCFKIKFEVLSNYGSHYIGLNHIRFFEEITQENFNLEYVKSSFKLSVEPGLKNYKLENKIKGPIIQLSFLDKLKENSYWGVNDLIFLNNGVEIKNPQIKMINRNKKFADSLKSMLDHKFGGWTTSWYTPITFIINLGIDDYITDIKISAANIDNRVNNISIKSLDKEILKKAIEFVGKNMSNNNNVDKVFDILIDSCFLITPNLIEDTLFYDFVIKPIILGNQPVFPMEKDNKLANFQNTWIYNNFNYLRVKNSKMNPIIANMHRIKNIDKSNADLQKISLDLKFVNNKHNHERYSTGLFLWPNNILEIEILEGNETGWNVLIGAHTDNISEHKTLKRFPTITLKKNLTNSKTEIFSPFGGIVYIETAGKRDNNIELRIKGAVKIPHITFNNKEDIINYDPKISPFFEIESEKLIITFPISVILEKNINREKMIEIMKFYDKVISAQNELEINPNIRKERFVADIAISVGYMHSGYPIMMLQDQYDQLFNEEIFTKGAWGLFHELGHNKQRKRWTFDGAFTEVTVNLFSVYAINKVLKNPESHLHGNIKMESLIEKFNSKENLYNQFGKDPFLALMCYLQITYKFGWEPIKNVFKIYRDEGGDNIKYDNDINIKIAIWIKRLSIECNADLRYFYTAWGFPISEELKNDSDLKNLVSWIDFKN